jgi:capsular polysaccharide export protein
MATPRRFLLLQGPHGPFFARLAAQLTAAGAEVWRVGLNGGDSLFWRDRARYLPYRGPGEAWEGWLADRLDTLGITDVVLYGEPRPIHASALALARARGLRTHILEEGYLRPYWITYERDGSNGNSPLMTLDMVEMRAALGADPADLPEAPAHWGDMREHIVYGALYHAAVLTGSRRYPLYRSHRDLGVVAEFRLWLRRLALMPAHRVRRAVSTFRLKRGSFPFHLVLLQLDHDASFRAHSPFGSAREFIEVVLTGFARGAPAHHHLVFKAHPLEDGRAALAATIAREAAALGLSDRVHFVVGGKLAPLLDAAKTAVTVNSTAAQQALWRGLPVKAFGRAVYGKPGFTSDQPLPAFFADPIPPDLAAYRAYRQFLLKTCQVRGGFYSARGRRELLRRITDLMLAEASPYAAFRQSGAASGQQLRLVGPGLR